MLDKSDIHEMIAEKNVVVNWGGKKINTVCFEFKNQC